MLKITCFICTYEDGRQYPVLNVAPDKFNMFYELGMYELSTSSGVGDAIGKIGNVIDGSLKEYQLSSGDWCVVLISCSKSIVSNNFDEFEPFDIDTDAILQLMKKWYDFLLAYESGNIPGIKFTETKISS